MKKKLITAAGVALLAPAAWVAVGNSEHNPTGCRARPAGVSVQKCSRVCGRDPAGVLKGPLCDSGDGNAMRPGQWIDHGGCVEVPCVVLFAGAAP